MTTDFENVILEELRTLEFFLKNFDRKIVSKIINTIHDCRGKVVVTGIGKSGIIGKKIAATFASTGTESIFLHSTEAFHGDLGMINQNDIVLLISFSGNTQEVSLILNYCLKYNLKTIALTGDENSPIAKKSNFHLTISVKHEACSLKLAPTSSTTLTLAIGDALAVSLMEKRNFKEVDFAKYHPGGNLGKKILSEAKDYMITNIQFVDKNDCFSKIVSKITRSELGICVIKDQNDRHCGVITDGDLRRMLEKVKTVSDDIKASDFGYSKPLQVNSKEKINECEKLMNLHKVNVLLVVDIKNNLVGLLSKYHIQ